ncbi:UNVERIFIED_CONTAM: hypothetical protein FKN15_043175 [Acipenser sinensis]
MSLSVVPALLWLAALCSLLPPAVTAKRERCDTCRLLTDSFNKVAPVNTAKDFPLSPLLPRPPPAATPEKGLFEEITDDEVLVLQQMFFGVVICALATLAAKGDMVFTAIFIGGLTPEKGLFEEITDDEVLVLQQMFFGVVICALATLAAKGDMVFTAIFIGGLAAMAGYWLSEKGDRLLEGFLKGR